LDTVFREVSATERVAEVALSHLSVELGHLYMDDLVDDLTDLDRYFERVALWADTPRLASLAGVAERRLRASTCLLIDDYFASSLRSPADVVPELVAAASRNGLRIDYIARESACAQAGDVPLASLVEASLVDDPPPGTNGSRPPTHETGWLCNGTRSPGSDFSEAMRPAEPWRPPAENGARVHSIFLDVELWNDTGSVRTWSCPFLAAVWQLLRLGLLRVSGESAVAPVQIELAGFPDTWSDFPAVARLNPQAPPFCAYRTFSVMDTRFLPVEHAVRTILAQVAVDPVVLEQTARRSSAEDAKVPLETADRISYTFLSL
jgi:hypothetical protein